MFTKRSKRRIVDWWKEAGIAPVPPNTVLPAEQFKISDSPAAEQFGNQPYNVLNMLYFCERFSQYLTQKPNDKRHFIQDHFTVFVLSSECAQFGIPGVPMRDNNKRADDPIET